MRLVEDKNDDFFRDEELNFVNYYSGDLDKMNYAFRNFNMIGNKSEICLFSKYARLRRLNEIVIKGNGYNFAYKGASAFLKIIISQLGIPLNVYEDVFAEFKLNYSFFNQKARGRIYELSLVSLYLTNLQLFHFKPKNRYLEFCKDRDFNRILLKTLQFRPNLAKMLRDREFRIKTILNSISGLIFKYELNRNFFSLARELINKSFDKISQVPNDVISVQLCKIVKDILKEKILDAHLCKFYQVAPSNLSNHYFKERKKLILN